MVTPGKIAKVQLVRKSGRWGGYKVREVTPGGRVLNSYDFTFRAEAKACAKRLALFHNVECVEG
jgi:hypothetical protein